MIDVVLQQLPPGGSCRAPLGCEVPLHSLLLVTTPFRSRGAARAANAARQASRSSLRMRAGGERAGGGAAVLGVVRWKF